MDARLRRLLAELLDRVDTLSGGLVDGHTDPTNFHNDMVRLLGEYHMAAWLIGRGLEEISPETRRIVGKLLGTQVDYLNGFTDAIERGELSEAMIRARAALYSGSIKETFSRAATWGWDLPYFPTQTACLMNCGCWWEINVLEGDGNADATWHRSKDDSCGVCIDRAGEVIRFRGGKRQ